MPESTHRRPRLAVGLISGTSMDGIDAALIRLSGSPEKPRVRLLAFTTLPYSKAVRGRILRIAGGEPVDAEDISQLNYLLGELFAEAALKVCRRGKVSASQLSVVGSHGQTIYHQGAASIEAGRRVASTFQIAEPAVIAARTGTTVVADFRAADMAAGGQGAPLVPMVDYLLLGDARQGTVALNIGGIANVTVIPAGARPGDVLGFDTGPGNMVIDALVRHHTRGRKTYDAGGRLAARGKVIEPVLAQILRQPFFRRPPPKSAGREQFGAAFVNRYFLRRQGPRFEDLLRTATELTPSSIADALQRFVFPRAKIHRLIVSGGGAHNRLLVSRLGDFFPQLTVDRSDRFGLPVDAKEAIAFAVLADRTLHGLPGNLPTVTGASRPVVLGKAVHPWRDGASR
ncbi:MAG: anhydro-N-acetylmuramic acid kinase [Acidobacteria bacterium]|nr:anhydro-N-acetylmuramic acid kinase [Acidobacteriota bacterium]